MNHLQINGYDKKTVKIQTITDPIESISTPPTTITFENLTTVLTENKAESDIPNCVYILPYDNSPMYISFNYFLGKFFDSQIIQTTKQTNGSCYEMISSYYDETIGMLTSSLVSGQTSSIICTIYVMSRTVN
jgi:hypothetical protein